MTIRNLLFTIAGVFVLPIPGALADDIGHGKTNDPDTVPPETTAETCTSSLECAWQELLDVFEMDAE